MTEEDDSAKSLDISLSCSVYAVFGKAMINALVTNAHAFLVYVTIYLSKLMTVAATISQRPRRTLALIARLFFCGAPLYVSRRIVPVIVGVSVNGMERRRP